LSLHLDWASFDAAKYACENWHYSGCLPAGKLVRIGVWEDDKYIGVVLFSRGANNHIGSPYGLSQLEVCELTRVALRAHQTPVSRIVTIAIKFLRKQSPGLKLIVSYADPDQGHHGGIYQACGWTYTGPTKANPAVMHNGKVMHMRTAASRFGTIKGMVKSPPTWKHKYLMALDPEIAAQILKLRKVYPKRAKLGDVGDQPNSGGATPTHPLQTS
jgi:hypothetical protein